MSHPSAARTTPSAFRAWPSPITAAAVARQDGTPGWVSLVGDEVWWDEPRPHEAGRRCVVRARPDGEVEDVLPAGFDARNGLHEYGGRSWRPTGDGLVFTHWHDQRLYVHCPDGPDAPRPLTPTRKNVTYGDLYLPPSRDEVWAVRETRLGGVCDVERALVAVSLSTGTERTIAATHRFMTCPRMSPDGRHLSWIGWNHPNMPWDGTELCVAPLRADGTAGVHALRAGGPRESVVQAEWRDADSLWAVTDPDGWWNLHLVPARGGPARPVAAAEEEFGGALWKPGTSWFAPLPDGRAVAINGTGAGRRISLVDPDAGPGTPALTHLDLPYTDFVQSIDADAGRLVAAGAATTLPYAVFTAAVPATGAVPDHEVRIVSGSFVPDVDPAWLPRPTARTFPAGATGSARGRTGTDDLLVHAHTYPPAHPHHTTPDGERPPWVIFVHGGPTGDYPMVYDLEIAYFTSRGIGVATVDYGGAVGYGRAYRERLNGAWGIVDVQDCVTVAWALVAEGLADPDRLAIRGGSAGGWTALAALTHTDAFVGAVSFYGITDPVSWADTTHDFESRYLDGLIGPLPQSAALYEQRSPVLAASHASGPALLLHGLEDVIVDPAQSSAMARALRAAGIPYEHAEFPGERHGWRRAETIRAALEAEIRFYERIFTPPEGPAAGPDRPVGSPLTADRS
ncbi:alpha/beta hydrolase family protein [Streptomyces wedmorensis]|uniref:alpha/beta hydrolase family protein n=1 Tax=Streptomyces wedmorensis TaxID=43759 RepID=UPI0007C5DA32|nr:prolyl oligopeptidase family serine peptidase [Streptomyces wedmorensis]